MTAKEKAYEIFDKYMGFKMNPYNDPEMFLSKAIAKSNAMILIDEILNLCWNGNDIGRKHWQDVKQEIQKI
jgi:hypothetical protein